MHEEKGGASIVPSDNFDGERTAEATHTMHAIGIDIDTGAQLKHTVDKLVERGIFAAVYTTHSHLKTSMEIKSDVIQKALKIKDTPTKRQVQEYLTHHHKDRHPEEFIAAIEIVDAKKHSKHGLFVEIKHPPVEKFRVVIPLAEPVRLKDLADSFTGWKTVWADAVAGVCVNMLDVDFDVASCDINRLFYTPRHPEGGEFYCAVIAGKPLHFDDIEPYSKEKYLRERKAAGDPFRAGSGDGSDDVGSYVMPESGDSLNAWHRKYMNRFELVDVIETFAPEKIRHAGNERQGTIHIECPFEHEHTTPGGTAAMVMNPDANSHDVWTVFCHHDACKGRHKLAFLEEMLKAGWFEESVLYDERYMIPAPDQDMEASREFIEQFEPVEDWLPDSYVVGKEWVFFETAGEADEETVHIPVCGVFEVVGRTADASGTEGTGRIVSFINENGLRKELTLERASLFASGPDVIRQLADAGLPLEAGSVKPNERLLNLFRRIKPQRLVPTVHQPGKHGDSFVLPTGEIVGPDVLRLHEEAAFKDTQKAGTLEEWKPAANAALMYSDENPYWTLSLCSGFAGPLLEALEWAPTGFVLSGGTSKGKSLGCVLAASVWGNPKDGKAGLWTATSTPNAYEDLAVYGSGTFIGLDELGAVQDKRQLAPLLFALHAGRSKARKRGNGPGLTRTVEFRPFVVFSSETNIKAEIEAAGVPYRGGMAVRFPDVDVGNGVDRTPAEIAEIEDCRKHYGHAGSVFVKHLMDAGVFSDPRDLEKAVNEIASRLSEGKSPALRRAARPFALALRGGEMAIDAGLIGGHNNVDARRRVSGAVEACWKAFLASDEAASANGSQSMLDAFRSWVASEMDRTILRAGQPFKNPDEAFANHAVVVHTNHDARGRVIGWYTDELIYLDWKQLETLQIPGSFGKRAALVTALDECGALDASAGSHATFTSLPANIASLTIDGRAVGKSLRNLRIKRAELGI